MQDRTYGFAIVGCGVIAPTHARAIGDIPNAELRAVVDVVPERARKLAAEFGAEPYTERVQHRVADRERLFYFRDPVLQQTFVTPAIDNHLDIPRIFAYPPNTKRRPTRMSVRSSALSHLLRD